MDCETLLILECQWWWCKTSTH